MKFDSQCTALVLSVVDDADVFAHGLQCQRAQILPVYANGTGTVLELVEVWKQVAYGGLAAAGGSHQGELFALFDMKGHVVQHLEGGIIGISDVVKIDLSGASKFTGDVEANSLKVYLSGSAACVMKGVCHNTMHIHLSGASHLPASGVNAQSVKGSMSGGSYAEVTCCTDLTVHLSGASHLVYGTVDKDCRVAESCEVSGGSTVQRWADNK